MIITAYKTSDGKIFEGEKDANSHQTDILGEALDTLLPDVVGNYTRTDRFKILMAMLDDKELATKVSNLNAVLEYMAQRDEEY